MSDDKPRRWTLVFDLGDRDETVLMEKVQAVLCPDHLNPDVPCRVQWLSAGPGPSTP